MAKSDSPTLSSDFTSDSNPISFRHSGLSVPIYGSFSGVGVTFEKLKPLIDFISFSLFSSIGKPLEKTEF
jgi:hypothetical protein